MKEIEEGPALNLYGAINGDRLQEAEEMLRTNPALLDGYYSYKKQPMMVDAAELGHLKVMEWLHAHGASLEQADVIGFTPLHAAAYGNMPEVVEYLLEKKVCLEPVCEGGDTPLLTAGRMGHLDVFDRLRAAGANAHATTGVENGSKDVVTLFLGQLSELPSRDPDHDAPDCYHNVLWGLCGRLEITKPVLAARVLENEDLFKQLDNAEWAAVLAELKSVHLEQQWQFAPIHPLKPRM